MNDFGAAVVGDLCEAIADYVDSDPKAAARVARKLGSTIRERQKLEDAREERRFALEEKLTRGGS